MKAKAFLVFAGGMAIGLIGPWAQANGINPPEPKGNPTIRASCEERSSGITHSLARSTIEMDGVKTDAVNLRQAGAVRQMPIAEIRRLSILSTNVDRNGFASAKVLRAGGAKEEVGLVQVRSAQKPVSLSGFASDNRHELVNLSNCAVITFMTFDGNVRTAPGGNTRVFFVSDESTLSPEGKDVLDAEVVSRVARLPRYEMILVTAHADASEAKSQSLAQQLSERRANIVLEYLVSKGIERAKIETLGMGRTQPAPGPACDQKRASDQSACNQDSRRVEIEVKERAIVKR